MLPKRFGPGTVIPGFLIFVALLAIWQWYSTSGSVERDLFPPPLEVAEQGWRHRDELLQHTLATLKAVVLGFSCSLLVSALLSIVIDRSSVLRRALVPLLVGSQTLPLVVIAPLVVIWFGFGLTPKILLVAFLTFFAITISLLEGYNSTDRETEQLLRSMGASTWQQFRYARLPTAVPYFFAGLRISITYAIVGAVFAEYAGATEGLGIYMQTAKNSFRTDLVLAAVAVCAALTLLLYCSTYLLEHLATPWRRHRTQTART